MSISAPKCRTCGKVEWGHVCSGSPKDLPKVIIVRADKIETKPRPVAEPATTAGTPKTDRKEYLRLKARDRRARQKVEKGSGE